MFQILQSLGTQQILVRQVPTLVATLTIAEVFYKFHSFTLECLAFLATWFVLDAGVETVAGRKRNPYESVVAPPPCPASTEGPDAVHGRSLPLGSVDL